MPDSAATPLRNLPLTSTGSGTVAAASAISPPSHAYAAPRLTDRRWWPWLRRLGSLLFFSLVLGLLASQARRIEWDKVLSALANYPVATAWVAAGLAMASFILYSCFDLLGRRYTGHRLSAGQVMTTTYVSYVFNLNLGSLLGAVATRYRLYSRLGLAPGVITRVLTMSMLTNWMGFLLLAGLVFAVQPPLLPDGWKVDTSQLRWIGLALLATALAYLAACALSKQRSFTVRGHVLELPSARMACVQVVMGASNWLLMSGIVFILLQQRIELPTVISVLLLAAVAGVLTHIPAGLGVLEAVFVALLSHRMPEHELLAALVAYRVVYYLAPLSIAALIYLLLELRSRKLGRRLPTASPTVRA